MMLNAARDGDLEKIETTDRLSWSEIIFFGPFSIFVHPAPIIPLFRLFLSFLVGQQFHRSSTTILLFHYSRE